MNKILAVVLFVVITGVTVNAQSKMNVGLNGGISVPLATYGDIVKTGYGSFANFYYKLSNNFSLGITGGYLMWELDADDLNEALKEAGFPEIDADFTNVPVMASARYFFSNESFAPYANLDLGAHFLTVEAAVPDFMTGEIITESDSKTAFGWGVGIGSLVELSSKLSLDINAKLGGNSEKATKYEEDGTEEESTLLFFNITAGLQIAL